MSKANLQEWLVDNQGFQRQYKELVIDSVSSQFSSLKRPLGETSKSHHWNYLLFCASLLAQSERGKCQDTALRIAQFCVECSETVDAQRDAAAVILDTLANRPAIKLAEKRDLIKENISTRLPRTLRQDWTKRSFEQVISLSNFTALKVNKFQQKFWKEASDNDWISISAPTSAGKSFILGQWLADFLQTQQQANIIYIVPTRALIQQVQHDLEAILASNRVEDISVVTLPLKSSTAPNKSNLFIFTQERFHILLGEQELNINFDLLIVDEAQKIGDGTRGILLQQALETALHKNPRCKVLFASPMTNNPGIFLEDAPHNIQARTLVSDDVMVNQNLIWVSQVPRQPLEWSVELLLDCSPTELGKIELKARPTSTSKRLPFVAFALSNPAGGNVVYANGAAEAEKTAKQLYDLVGPTCELSDDKEIKDLIELIQKTIHKKYTLWNVLERGIAFHYGNMPLLVRTEIERLFSSNKIKYLVCTSTLIEGINMPCQTIFARGPMKGPGNPMTPTDFWNMAGRAGRWGKEFQGNVVCVDARQPGIWTGGPPTNRGKYAISRTCDEVLGNGEEMLAFIRKGSPREEAAKNPKLDYVFSYLVSSHLRYGGITHTSWAQRFDSLLIEALNIEIGKRIDTIETPPEVVLRNPGINPVAMDSLLTYFKHRTERRNEDVEGLLPVPPESEDAVNEYTKILHRLNSHFGKEFGFGEKRVRQLALLIVNWMQGYQLARIISSREQFYRARGDNFKTSLIIRQTMADVEGIARFKAPKYLACYVDLLRVYLQEINRQDLLERLLDLNILLEYGVSQTTQLSLMGLGLSRSTAIAISEIISNDAFSGAECIMWLKTHDWITEDLPEIVKREIYSLLKMA